MAKKSLDIVYNAFVKAPPSRVFRALTDPKEITKWFIKEAQIEAKNGGRFVLGWGRSIYEESKVIEFVHDKVFSFTWNPGPDFPAGPVVTFKLTPKSGGTVVTLEHKGFDTAGKALKSLIEHEGGWSSYMCNFKCYVEKGYDLRDPWNEISTVQHKI